jgi:2-oxo-4-hydroxy-4-carboxy-5-ureidoimidazoline decarboxylase
MRMIGKHTISEINQVDAGEAVDLLGGLFEQSPRIVEAAWRQAPFESVTALHAALCQVVRTSPRTDQLALIRAHPYLVGAAARAGTLTRESTGEQRAAGLGPDDLTADDLASFTRSNADYQARFGFPFVICARENKKASILAGFRARMDNDPATERYTAIREIERIAWYRLNDLVMDDPGD